MPTFGKKERLRAGRRRGRLNTRHSESGVWPPTEWKPLEECPQVKLGIIDPKIYDLDLQQFHADDNARIFLHQLRDSRGYELEINAPKRVIVSLYLVYRRFWKRDPYLMDKLKFVTKQINDQAKKHDEEYELVECVRFVVSLCYNCDLFTFNVRQVVPAENDDALKTVQAMVRTIGDKYELMEWRFRPGPPQTPPELLTLETPTDTASSSSDDSPKDYGIKSIGSGIF